jgi:peptidoglycan-associated lipoprotein
LATALLLLPARVTNPGEEGRMARRVWQILVTITCLALAGALLDGCAGRSATSGGAGAQAGAAGATEAARAGGPGRGAPAGSAPGSGPGTDAGMAAGVALPALPAPSGFAETSALRDVHFDFDRYAIRPPDARILEDGARWLAANARAIVLIEGHADERGTNEYNLALGERRAAATRDYLVALGVARSRITLLSYGEERPLCGERTEPCWAENRRAHFLVRLR